jgi:glycosyltransferase involved in cell wall biosynthesis
VRALVLTTSYPLGSRSLSGRFIEELLHGLTPRGWTFHVVTPAPPGGARRLTTGPITVEPVDYPWQRAGLVHTGGMPDRLARAPWLAAAVPGMWRALARAAARSANGGDFDLIWSHWLLSSGWIGAAVARAARLPHLATAHGGDVHLAERIAQWPGGRAVLRSRFEGARLCAPAAHTAARVEAALGIGPVAVAPLPADVTPAPAPARAPGAPLRLLFLGRFEAIKGAGLLIEAARLMGRTDVEVVMAGTGHEAPALRAAAEGLPCRIDFPGALTGDDRRAALGRADLLVVPSRRGRSGRAEGLPHAASLALATGTPVVAPEGGALAALLRAHDAGQVYAPGADDRSAARALAAAIEAFAADPDLRAGLRRGALEAGAAFHAERALPQWDHLLRGITGPAPAASARRALVLEPQR